LHICTHHVQLNASGSISGGKTVARSKGRKKKRKRRAKRALNKAEEVQKVIDESLVTVESDRDDYPNVQSIPMVKIAVIELLRGTNVTDLMEVLRDRGYICGRDKCYRLMKLAKKEIMRRSEKDIAANFAWAEENFKRIMREAMQKGDHRVQIVAIKELVSLWGLNNPENSAMVQELEVTPEMIEQFEQMILR